MTDPVVSVVIPARDAESSIADALRSVFRQTYRTIECIVVDDGSTDGTAAAVSRFPEAKVITHPTSKGVSAARNAGVHVSSGPLIAFLDADDAWVPDKLARQVEAMAERPDVGILLSGYQLMDATLRRTLGVVRGDGTRDRIMAWLSLESDGPAFSSTGLVRRAAFEAAGGFTEDLSICEDIDFVLRVSNLRQIDAVADSLAYYRVHKGQSHKNVIDHAENLRRMYPAWSATLGRSVVVRCESNVASHVAFKLMLDGHTSAAWPWFRDALRIDARSLVRLPLAIVRRRLKRKWLAIRSGGAAPPPHE